MPETPTKDYLLPSESRTIPKAVVDVERGAIVAMADVAASPEAIFRAFSTQEVERWWFHPDYYWSDWKAELRVCGPWSVTVHFADGSKNTGWGEFAAIAPPQRLVMTRIFEQHPLPDRRETTITYSLCPIEGGTRVNLRDEGFIGRTEAALGNAEHWERVLGWLQAYSLTGGSK